MTHETFAQMVQPLKKTWCKHHTASIGMYNTAINMLYKLQSCVLWGFLCDKGSVMDLGHVIEKHAQVFFA